MGANGKIEVINRCRKSSGEYATAKGKAKIVDKKTNGKLKVTFFWPFYSDYWILDLGPTWGKSEWVLNGKRRFTRVH
jgi:apolipoprotein D and lipocalin family protein